MGESHDAYQDGANHSQQGSWAVADTCVYTANAVHGYAWMRLIARRSRACASGHG